MVRKSSCCMFAFAAWLLSGAAIAEGPAAGLSEQRFAGLPTDAPVVGDCKESSQGPCVRFWADMSAEERARLWPFLDEVSKNTYWRGMTPKERRSLKENLSEHDLEALRRRYTVDIRSEIHETQPKLCGDERKRIREQVIEVHMQFMRGVPRTGGPQPLNPPSGRGEIHLGVPGGGSMGGPGGPGGMGGGPGGGPRH